MSKKLLEQIENWKLEAKLENNHRYFYHTRIVSRLENGSRSYVIGRKGTGKTAITEYLNNKRGYKTFTTKLTFKNFPFNELYDLQNDNYNPPNQYITLWKYVIYSSIAKMMAKNANINPLLRDKIRSVYNDKIERSLSKSISRWTGAKFNLSILGHGGGAEVNRCDTDAEHCWIDRIDLIEDVLLENIDNSTYLIIFDELDEDYKDIIKAERHRQYTALLTSLFKSVQDIRAIFRDRKYRIYPIIFLRDDIYDLLQDPDKTKWNDLKVDISWNIGSLKELMAFRISRAINAHGDLLPFQKAWASIFMNKPVRFGHRQQKASNSFNYITRSTQLRPRDYVRYLQACAESTLSQNRTKIGPKTVVRVDKSFSNYLRSEIEDEIHGALPEIKHILDLFSKIRKQTLPINTFEKAYQEAVEKNEVPERNLDFILKILFHFSVIGNQPKQKNVHIFRYERPEARFNFNESIVVHRGLFKALQIL